jgi:hypothetical protein
MPTAPLPVLPGVYYGRVEGTSSGKPITNIFSFKKDGLVLNDPADVPNAAAVATALASNWPRVPNSSLHVDYVGVEVSVYALGSVLAPAAVTPLSAAGGVTGADSFRQVAGRVSHTVSRRGRGSQHSTHLSPISVSDVNAAGDQMLAGWVTATNASFGSMISDMIIDLNTVSPGTWHYVQVSKFQGGVYTPNSFHITGSAAQVPVGSQRRRL